MSIALAENPDHISELCSRLAIGIPQSPVSSVKGGFHHRMWRLQTDQGVYAVKQLSDATDVADTKVVDHFNLTETAAECFAAYGIESINALKSDGVYVQLIAGCAYLVYPWSEAKGLAVSELSSRHALQVARMLATMHLADVKVPGLKPSTRSMDPEDQITEVVSRAAAIHVRYADDLEQALPVFLEIARLYAVAMPLLAEYCVISHGDLDQKNVLWDYAGNAQVIDWESARPLNPTYELMQTALEWSGITRAFDESLFEAFLVCYQQAGGVIDHAYVEPALHALLGDWLLWLMYVVDRSTRSSNPVKRKRGADQFDLVFDTLIRLHGLLPSLLSMAVLHPAQSAS